MRPQGRALVIGAVVALLLGLVGPADAGGIFPVDPTTGALNAASAVTVSLFQNGTDVTSTWLPSWTPTGAPQPVLLVFNVNGVVTTASSVTLVDAYATTSPVFTSSTGSPINPFLSPPTTSRYPGQCTNYGSPTDLSLDYSLALTAQGYQLTPLDCGGMAVIQATVNGGVYTFIVPQDTNLNGIPDVWETVYCPSTNPCPTGTEDNDPGPVAGSPPGDGIAAFDEYRGFIISGAHYSTDPRQRDLFVHLVNPQCLPAGTDPLTSMASLVGQPNGVVGALIYPTDGTPLFLNLDTLTSGSQVHLLGYVPRGTNYTTSEWVDRFVLYSEQPTSVGVLTNVTGFVYQDSAGNLTTTAPVDDRVINQNALFPLGVANPVTGRLMQKGLRVTECLDTSVSSPFGVAGLGSPDGGDNGIIYTARARNYINSLIASGGNATLRYLTFVNGSWTAQADNAANTIVSRAIQYYLSMEMGHSVQLTPTIEGTNKTSYGYHHAPGTGSNLDQALTTTLKSGVNSFYIPLYYNGNDQSSFQLE